MSEKNKDFIDAVKNGDIAEVKRLINGDFELVDEVNARQTHKNLLDAIKNNDIAAVTAALESGANTSYDQPKLVNAKNFNMSNVSKDFVINTALLKDFKSDAIVGDIHGLPSMSESEVRTLLLHEMAQIHAGNTPSNKGITLQEALKGPEGQGNTEAYKAAAKDVVGQLGLNFVEPAALREKFNSAEKKDTNTPK